MSVNKIVTPVIEDGKKLKINNYGTEIDNGLLPFAIIVNFKDPECYFGGNMFFKKDIQFDM